MIRKFSSKKCAVDPSKKSFGTLLTSKNGAIEMSLNLIIMLIIGMVVLGLVIGFVNSLVNKGSETFENQIGEQDQLKLDEVANCRDNLCVLPKPTLTVEKGKPGKLYIKIRNSGTLDVECGAGPIANCADDIDISIVNSEGTVETLETSLKIIGQGFILSPGDESSVMYTIEVLNDLSVGTYFMTMKSLIDGSTIVLTVNVE